MSTLDIASPLSLFNEKHEPLRNRSTFFNAFSILLTAEIAMADQSATIGRDGDFVASANGVVLDTRTGIEWIAGPDVDTSHYQAVKWVCGSTVAGGGWR